MAITGGCRCGAVRYALTLEAPPPAYACHCLDCQTISGSAFALNAIVPAGVMAVEGALIAYDRGTPDRPASMHHLCAVCHTRIYSRHPATPDGAILRAGTLDDSQSIAPVAHIWTRRKQAWVVIPADVPTWPESPTPAEYAAANRRAG